MPSSILLGVTVVVVTGACMGPLLLRVLRIQQTTKVIKVTVNKTLKESISAKLASGLDMSDLILPLNSSSCSCKCSARQYALPIATQLPELNDRGVPSHDAPYREPANFGDDLEHHNGNAIVKPGISPNFNNVHRTDDDSERALCC